MFNQSILSIDIGTYYIKIIIGKQIGNKVSIRGAHMLRTPTNTVKDGQILDIQRIMEALEGFLQAYNIKTKRVVFTIGSTYVITREILLPPVSEREIDDLLQYEVQQYFPTTLEEYVVQYKVLETVTEGSVEKLRILVAALPKMIVENYLELTKKLNLKPMALDVHSNGITKLFGKSNTLNSNTMAGKVSLSHGKLQDKGNGLQGKILSIIDFGYEGININIIKEGIPQFNRILTIGGKELDIKIANTFNLSIEEAAKLKQDMNSLSVKELNILQDLVNETINSWLEEIQRIFKFYTSRSPRNKIDEIYLIGGHADTYGLREQVEGYFEIPTNSLKTMSNIEIKTKEKNIDFNFKYYCNAIGAIIRK